MIWQEVTTFLQDFLNEFLRKPSPDFSGVWPLDLIVRSESIHFMLSCALGWLVFLLTWIILSSGKCKWSDRFIYRTGLLWGLFASVTTHIFVDAFTTWA